VKLRADAVIPEPWTGIDPPMNGIRVVVDAVAGGGGFDVALPGGVGWRTAKRRWIYVDPTGAVGGITKAIGLDRRAVEPGMLRVVVKGRPATLALPPASATRTTVVFGDAAECARITWNGPGGASPRCTGDAARLVCR